MNVVGVSFYGLSLRTYSSYTCLVTISCNGETSKHPENLGSIMYENCLLSERQFEELKMELKREKKLEEVHTRTEYQDTK